MFERRLECSAELELLSPLHLGSGERVRRADIRDPEDTRADAAQGVWVACIQVDDRGLPIIPGSTVKGMLRHLAGDDPKTDRMFGMVRSESDGAGRLTAWTALTSSAANAAELPHFDPRRGTYIHARVRIDPATGVAADRKLFHAEMVPAGHRFRMRLSVDLHREADDALTTLLFRLMARLARPEGVPCGRGQTQGNGRLRLSTDSLEVTELSLGEDGEWVRRDRGAEARAASAGACEGAVVLTLACPGPYLSVDSSKHSLHGKAKTLARENDAPAQTEPLGGNTAMVTGSSVLGALRARAGWLAGVRAMREGKSNWRDDSEQPFTTLAETTAVQRLFGLGGWRGRVRIGELSVLDPGRDARLTNVAIDPFSGGAIDGALFTTRAFTGVRIGLALHIDPREGLPAAMAEEDQSLFDDLVADLRANGLVLGHGGNKGFGWFEVEKEGIDG